MSGNGSERGLGGPSMTGVICVVKSAEPIEGIEVRDEFRAPGGGASVRNEFRAPGRDAPWGTLSGNALSFVFGRDGFVVLARDAT